MKNLKQLSETRYKGIAFFLCILFVSAVSVPSAQAQYKLSNSKENEVKILGTSNVHDWTMIAQNPACEAEFTLAGDDVKNLTALSFSVNAKSLKSEHESMDSRTYKTIKADTYPKITFKLSNAVVTKLPNNKFTIKATGTVTIAGATQIITMLVNGEVKPDNSITCTGQQQLKLTDFKIDPPSFMLGAMKVRDGLTIQYTLNFKK